MITFFQKALESIKTSKPSEEENFQEMLRRKHRLFSEGSHWKIPFEVSFLSSEVDEVCSGELLVLPGGNLVRLRAGQGFVFYKSKGMLFCKEGRGVWEKLSCEMQSQGIEGSPLAPDDFLHNGDEIHQYEVKYVGEGECEGQRCSRFILFAKEASQGAWPKVVVNINLELEYLIGIEFFDRDLNLVKKLQVLETFMIHEIEMAKRVELMGLKGAPSRAVLEYLEPERITECEGLFPRESELAGSLQRTQPIRWYERA